MSDILIREMKMPKDGRYTLCITHDSSGGVHWVFQNEDTLEFLKHGRVKELPPHGRLIDADALMERFNQFCEYNCDYTKKQRDTMCGSCGIGCAIDMLDDAPTVIPAEPTKEETCTKN